MKRKWLGLALAAVMACAGAATATEYTDSSANYPDGWATGSNGGAGFGAWTIATTSGGDGWAGCGIWDPSANEFQGSWTGKTTAFGMMGKGDGFSVMASRSFRKALAVGDSFSLEMAVNWDSNREGAKKGFVLTAGGADIVTVNHEDNPGKISVNGDDTSDILNAYGVNPMVWTFTAKDATTISVTATARDDSSKVYEADLTGLATSAIDGFRLQSAEQDNQNEDRRQSYYDNFKLDIAGDLPDLVTLKFDAGEWAVSSAAQTLSYTLTRSSSEGALDVTVSSSDEAFVAGTTVSFADGETSKDFTLDATLTGSGNFATLTASATGCDPATFDVKGPQYRLSAEKYEVNPDETINFWMNWDDNGIALDEAKVTIEANPADSLELPTEWTWNTEDGGAYVASSFKAVSSGTLILKYDGVQFADYNVTVIESGATLSGPTSLRVGNEETYTLAVTLAGDIESDTFQLVADNEDLVSIDPADAQELTESGTLEFKVTALAEGDVTLSVIDDKGLDADIAPITVSITEAPDYSGYVAYDDASLYDLGDLNYASVGEGTDKFLPWDEVYKNADGESTFAGAVVVTAAPDPSALTEGQAFALYANGADGAEIQLRRQFANPLDNGQAFSVVVSPNYRDGTKGVKFMGVWEGEWYPRAEFFYNNDGYFYKLDGDEDATNLGWEYATDAITITLKKAADGSSYTLSFARGDEIVAKEGITSFQGTVDCAQFYSWQGGNGDENNLVFNRLAIEQVEEPVPPAPPAVTMALSGVWNPDEVGVPYEFTLTPSEVGAIGLVDLSLEGEGAELSATQVDLTEGAATFTFTLTGDTLPSGAEFKITASAQDVDVEDATYGITVWEPSTMLVVVGGQYEFDYVAGGTVEFWLYGTPKFVGQQANLDSGNEAILAPPSPAVATVVPYYTESDEGKFAYTMVGTEEGQAWVHATKDEAEWGYAGITINGKAAEPGDVVPVKSISIKDGAMTLTLDGPATSVYGATELENHGWKWQALDLAIVGDGTSVTLPMDAPKMIFKVE